MNKMTILYMFAALFALVSVVVNVLLKQDPSFYLSSDVDAVVAAALPLITSVYVACYFERGAPERRIWFILVWGLFFWLLGETLWLCYEAVGKLAPEASLADVAWLLGYPLILIAFAAQYRQTKVRLERKHELGIGAAVFLTGIAVLLLMEAFIRESGELTWLEEAVYLAYVVADFLLLYCAALMTGLYWGGKLSHAWFLVVLGIIFYSAGDIWFAYLEWQEQYLPLMYNPVDLTWILGDLLVFLGAAKYRLSFEEVA